MPISTKFLIVSLLAATLTACTGAKFKSAQGAKTYPEYKGEVRELKSFPQAGSFDRIGVVVVDGTENTDDARLRKRMLSEAAERGANAVIYQGAVKTVPYRDGAKQKRLAAFAIRLR